MTEAADLVGEVLDVELSSVLEAEPRSDQLLWRAAVGFERSPGTTPVLSRAEAGPLASADAGAAWVTFDDATTHPGFRASTFVDEHLVSGACILMTGPGAARESVYGWLFVGARRARAFDREEREFLEMVASIVGAALHRARATAELEGERDALQAVMEQFPAGVVFHDIADKHIKLISKRLDIIYGYPTTTTKVPIDDMIERYPAWFPNGQPLTVGDYAGVRALGGETIRQEILLGRVDGTRCPVIDTATPVYDRRGRVIGSVAAIHDISAEKAAAQERDRLLEEATRAVSVRDETLAIVSHDLRNPVGVVMLASALLRERAGGLDADRVRLLAEQIHRTAAGMKRIIGDLLDRARIDTGRLVIDPSVESAVDVVEEAIDASSLLAAERAIEVRPMLAGIEGVRLPCDRGRIVQALSNLMSNALKFGAPGQHIDVGARVDGPELVVFVHDEGPGIEPEHIGHVFDRYWQAGVKDGLGLGLGLAIVKGIVEAHGGRVWVDSPPNDGATFAFSLPLAKQSVALLG